MRGGWGTPGSMSGGCWGRSRIEYNFWNCNYIAKPTALWVRVVQGGEGGAMKDDNQPPILRPGETVIGRASSNVVPEKVVGISAVPAVPAGPRFTDALALDIHGRIVGMLLTEFQGADMKTAEKLSRVEAAVMRILREAKGERAS